MWKDTLPTFHKKGYDDSAMENLLKDKKIIDERLDQLFSARLLSKLEINHDLKRTLVSFQANKKEPIYRWCKFKEGYSAALVEYIIRKLGVESGRVIDPFAGSGTTLFVSSKLSLDAVGIELLPIGQEIMSVRKSLDEVNPHQLSASIKSWIESRPWTKELERLKFPHLKITAGAFSETNEVGIEKYLAALKKVKDSTLKKVLRFALLCILEDVSYTRKDGQYLRWDRRSGRTRVGNFDKGGIPDFDSAILSKLNQIYGDLAGLADSNEPKNTAPRGSIEVLNGSCLSILPGLKSADFDLLVTSPPYCNRLDYTRTYALELALLGVNEEELKSLRQSMVTCTVENREKMNLTTLFDQGTYSKACKAFDHQPALKELLNFLEDERLNDRLNNPGIARMVKNYFFELTLIIFESARLIKQGGYFVMVNDNVRYAGRNIPVDLILSRIAEAAGYTTKKIWVLPVGKGNSSQQMGVHGREELRKCVYVWRRL